MSRQREQRESLSRALMPLHRRAEPVRIASGETIFSEGENAANIYIIKRGVVRLCMTTIECGRKITDFMLAGDPLGAMEQTSYMWTAEAATDVDLLRITRAEVDDFLGRSGTKDALGSYEWQLAADAWRFQRAMIEQPPDQRVACFLVRFSQRTCTPAGHPLSLQISHKDIACHLGLTPEELSRSLEALAEQRAIDASTRGACTILDASVVIELVLRTALPKTAPKWDRTSPDLNSVPA